MPSKVKDKKASSVQPTNWPEKSTPVKTKEEQLARAREYAKTLSPARNASKKSPTRLSTPKKKAAAATSPACVKTLSKEEQLFRAREWAKENGIKTEKKNASSPVPAQHTTVRSVVIPSDASDSGYETANETYSYGAKKMEPHMLDELKRLVREEDAIFKIEEASGAVAAARAKVAKDKRDFFQSIIDENERMDCD